MLKDEIRICEICKKEYIPKTSNQKTCCEECSNALRDVRNKTHEGYVGSGMVKCQNPLCGKMFMTKQPKYAKYCSRKCRCKVNSMNTPRKGKVKTVCAWCGKEIWVRAKCNHNFCNNKHGDFYHESQRKIIPKDKKESRDSKCYDCKKASGKYGKMCCWAAFFKPVPGWEAEPTPEMKDANGYVYKLASYKVMKCREFDPDEVKA